MAEHEERSGIQVIARAASVFRALEGAPDGLTIAALSRQVSLPRTTVTRLIAALEQEKLLSVVEGRVFLGPALPRLAGANHTDVIAMARPHIEALQQCTDETVNLSVLRGSHALLVDQVASNQPLRVVSPIGVLLPLFSTAQGLAFLADMDDVEVTHRLDTPWTVSSLHTPADLPAVLTILKGVRKDGFAIDHQAHLTGVCGLACILRIAVTERYALSIALPEARMPTDPAPIVKALQKCADSIETAF